MHAVASDSASSDVEVTLRLAQVDAARVIFYPRVFELLFRYFPDNPLLTLPYAFRLDFLKPNHLGDDVNIVFDRDELSAGWTFTGRLKGIDHLVIRSLGSNGASLASGAHRQGGAAFATDNNRVGGWASDHTGHLQLSRYFEYLNETVEKWFEDTLDLRFNDLHVGRKIGIPSVRFTTRCQQLPRVHDEFSLWMRPRRIGKRAMTFTHWLVRDGECLVETEQTVVFVHMVQDGFESIPIPDDIRLACNARLGP